MMRSAARRWKSLRFRIDCSRSGPAGLERFTAAWDYPTSIESLIGCGIRTQILFAPLNNATGRNMAQWHTTSCLHACLTNCFPPIENPVMTARSQGLIGYTPGPSPVEGKQGAKARIGLGFSSGVENASFHPRIRKCALKQRSLKLVLAEVTAWPKRF
jgi:hypothetical protein